MSPPSSGLSVHIPGNRTAIRNMSHVCFRNVGTSFGAVINVLLCLKGAEQTAVHLIRSAVLVLQQPNVTASWRDRNALSVGVMLARRLQIR
jgi:hypothetical protein